MGLDWTVDSEQLDYKSTAGAVLKMIDVNKLYVSPQNVAEPQGP